MYRELLTDLFAHPVPHEGIVLPNDILRSPPISDDEPLTHHAKLLRAFYQILLTSTASSHDNVITLARKRDDTQSELEEERPVPFKSAR
jgi:hypothetical protein